MRSLRTGRKRKSLRYLVISKYLLPDVGFQGRMGEGGKLSQRKGGEKSLAFRSKRGSVA